MDISPGLRNGGRAFFQPGFIAMVIFSIISISAGLGDAEEYHLKAAFIYRFTSYIEWEKIPEKEFGIGIIGESPITKPLKEIAASKTVRHRKMIIHELSETSGPGTCSVVFISRQCKASLSEILARIPKRNVLVITEKPGYAEEGAAINFVIIDNKIRFEVNLKSLSSAGLKASSQLLKLAIMVENG